MIDKNRLLGAMAREGYSQRRLAQILKISKNTLNTKINGRTPFDTDLIDRICAVLNITDYKERGRIFLYQSSHYRDDLKEA